MRFWPLALVGALASIVVAAHAQAPDTSSDLLRKAPILRETDKLPYQYAPTRPFEDKTEPEPAPQPKSAFQPPHVPAALQEKLDAVLATKDYMAIAKTIAQAPPIERMTWLTTRLLDGNTVFLGYALVRDLWGMAQLKNQNPALEEDAGTAVGVMALYVLQVHILDGAMCEDVSAPGNRLTQYMMAFGPVFQSLKGKSVLEKQKLIVAARLVEAKSRPHRHGDDFLCRGGLAELKASVEHLGPGVTVGELAAKYGEKSKSGVGTDVKLPPPPKRYEPKFLPPEKYEPEQRKLRVKMGDTLDALLK
jgi:hypothetical protein